MIVTLAEAKAQLNIRGDAEDDELGLFVDSANEWVTEKVTDTTPSFVKLGTLFLIEHLWSSQRGPGSASAISTSDDEIVQVAGVGYAIPNRVLELLNPRLPKATPRGSFPAAAGWPDAVERGRRWPY